MTDSRPGDAFQPGDLLNNTYRIEAILGRGGTSDVYRARSEISGRVAALKVLKAEFSNNDDFLVLLTREEEIRDIRHDAVVRYSENNRTADGHVYLVMDYVDGPGLDQKLKQGPMDPADLLTVCRRVCEGLETAHSRNIVHRDLSPDNIILRDDDPAQAVIIDFGIAKDTNPGAETIVGNEFAGKYAYAAPEQLSGKTDARTDIYSLGALLLANFRGEKPDIGANPMEVVENKAKPLDTIGVPEPLKSLIDRMTAPNPDDRFQSTTEVLKHLAGDMAEPTGDVLDALSDATVIVSPPNPAKADADTTMGVPPDPKPSLQMPESGAKSRSGLVAVLLVVLLALGGAGAYFAGLIGGPSYPVADPFTLIVEKRENGTPRAIGFAPSEAMQTNLSSLMTDRSGQADLTLASGEIAETWGDDILAVVNAVQELDSWRLMVSGNEAKLSGATTNRELYDQLSKLYDSGLPGGLSGTAEISLTNLFLSPKILQPVLNSFADCGPLTLVDAPTTGYGPDSPVLVNGTMASAQGRAALFDAVRAVAEQRKVTIDTEILNPSLCLIENFLPKAPSSPIDVIFAFGDKDNAPNPSGRFLVGENPVIDIQLPASVVDGYLSVSALDVSGNVFHLLPNINRQDNAVDSLRSGRTGALSVRVAFSLSEASESGGLAFRVDDSALGKSKIIVIHSNAPLFDSQRPTTESATGYAEALADQERKTSTTIYSLDSRILTTAEN
jgi:eukaryotic-like serine/threonine-protein kinase